MFVYVTALVLVIVSLYFWFTKNNDYWKKKGVPFIPPQPLIGNVGEMLLMKKSLLTIITEYYNKHKDLPYIGLFNLMQPVLLVMDPNVIKNVLITDFNKFHDNTFELNEEADPILAKNPFFSTGEKWKIVRAQLTPLLTNVKMKAMFPLVQEVCKNMVKYLEQESDAIGENGLEAKELALKFTSDNVASCAFGLEGHSFDDPNAEFRKMAEEVLKTTTWEMMKFFIITLFPMLNKTLKLSIGQNHITDKFKKIMIDTVKYRKENNVKRDDFLDSIIELRSKPMPYEYTDDHMVAHAFTFFVDGSETSATVFSFAMFELAANPDIQNKLKDEIDHTLIKYNGIMTFEAILEMDYLDAIFNETLRKYPPLIAMTRKCTEETMLSDPNDPNKNIKIEKGTHIYIPTLGIHRNSLYYPDPDDFNPDRFIKDEKHSLPKNCFFGFGDGPRICIGKRFANMQVKLGLVTIVSTFKITVNNKTKRPLEINQTAFLLEPVGGLWLNFYKRKI